MIAAVPPWILVAAALLFVAVAAIGAGLYSVVYGPRARLRRRILQVTGGAERVRGKGGAAGPEQRRKAISSRLKTLEATRQKKRGYKLREEILQAGLSVSVRQFVLWSSGAAMAAGVSAVIFGLPLAGCAAFAIVGGLGLPRLVLKTMISRRLKKFTVQFADAIDVIVRGIRSGLPVGECFAMIAREMADPVGGEFRLIVEAQRLGLPFEEALQKAVERVPTAELRFFAIVLAIQQTTGGNLAETLSKLSEVLRARRRMRDKVQAMSSEAKSSAGIIGSLPIIVAGLLSLIAPDYISVLFTSDGGHLILFIGLSIMGTGIFVMRQMIHFDI